MFFLLSTHSVLPQAILPESKIEQHSIKHFDFSPYRPSESDIHWLAKVIYHEARDQSKAGQLAVAYVTITRTLNEPMGHRSIKAVIFKKNQYSWNKKKKVLDIEAWENAKMMAVSACYRYNISFFKANNVEFFHHKGIKTPKWTKKMHRVAQIGDHIFYTKKINRKTKS